VINFSIARTVKTLDNPASRILKAQEYNKYNYSFKTTRNRFTLESRTSRFGCGDRVEIFKHSKCLIFCRRRSFCLRAVRLFGDNEAAFEAARASCSREVEGVSVCSLSPVVLSTTTSRPTHSSCARENSSFFLSTLPKIVHSSRLNLRTHEKSKQHQLRLMNGGGDDDFFFFNNNNRQRQLTISTNSSTTSTTTTVAKRFQCRQCTKSYTTKQISSSSRRSCAFGIRHRCPNCKSTFSSKSLGSTSSSSVRTKAVSVRSMSKALSGARLAGRAQGVAHRGRFGSVLQVVRFVCVSVLLLLQLLCVGGRCSHSHSRRSHQQSAIQNHNKEYL
jgi:hypothetical protein